MFAILLTTRSRGLSYEAVQFIVAVIVLFAIDGGVAGWTYARLQRAHVGTYLSWGAAGAVVGLLGLTEARAYLYMSNAAASELRSTSAASFLFDSVLGALLTVAVCVLGALAYGRALTKEPTR